MPRPIVLSNGRLYVGIDRNGTVRELCWPNVGYPNHLVDGGIRLGVWVDGEFSWLDSGEWEDDGSTLVQKRDTDHDKLNPGDFTDLERYIVFEEQEASYKNRRLGLQLSTQFFFGSLESCAKFSRDIRITYDGHERQDIRLCLSQRFNINESDIGNTAFYDPSLEMLFHHKDDVWIGIAVSRYVAKNTMVGAIDQYACGTSGFGGMGGTSSDAEDGHLSGKAIEQGSVDSTLLSDLSLGQNTNHHTGEPLSSTFTRAEYYIGPNYEAIRSLVLAEKAEDRIERDDWIRYEYWENKLKSPALRAVADPESVFGPITWHSERYVLNHQDEGGGILAACDSDIMETARANYNYVWLRDGALVGNTLAELGHRDRAEKFWEFFLRCVGDREWAFQKYTVRGDVGASWMPWVVEGEPVVPFQQDESALPVWLGLKWGLEGGRKTCERFLNHMVEYRDVNGLPGQSWDLWEERRGVHFWTTATVIEALFAGAEAGFERSEEYREAGEKMVAAVREHFWDSQYACLARTIYPDGEGGYHRDLTPDASILLGLMHGRLGEVDGLLAGMAHRAENELAVRSSIGGIARYPGDYYFRRSEQYPGNPWVICTLWLARAKMLLAGSVEEAEEIAREAFAWCVERSESTYVLAEQFHPDTGEPLSVSPLTWSHAEVLDTALLLDRLKGK